MDNIGAVVDHLTFLVAKIKDTSDSSSHDEIYFLFERKADGGYVSKCAGTSPTDLVEQFFNVYMNTQITEPYMKTNIEHYLAAGMNYGFGLPQASFQRAALAFQNGHFVNLPPHVNEPLKVLDEDEQNEFSEAFDGPCELLAKQLSPKHETSNPEA